MLVSNLWYAANREICDYVTVARSIKEFSGINDNGFDLFKEKDGKNIIRKIGGAI